MTTTKQIKEWIDLYTNKHLSIIRIAEMCGSTRSTVSRYLRINGVTRPKGRPRFAKGYYILGIYDTNDNLLWLFESMEEMSKTLEIRYNTVECAVCRLKQGKQNNITINHKRHKIVLIEGSNESNNSND